MRTWLTKARSQVSRLTIFGAGAAVALLAASSARADEAGGEANLKLPDLSQVSFHGMDGHKLLLFGILFCLLGLAFGLVIFTRLKNLPVHKSMRGISELIYETCKTYLTTQGKFLLLLWVFIAIVIVLYFGCLHPIPGKPIPNAVLIILVFSLLGMAGSYSVAWFGIRVNTFANSRTAFAALRGKPYPINHIPLEAGMSVGMMLISVELLMMLIILLFIPGDYAGACFIGFAIGESLGAAALRIAGGFFSKAKYAKADDMNFEAPLTSLVWITSFVSIGLTYLASWLIIPELGGDTTQWWKLATIITCGTLAGAIIPELVKVFTSVESRHTKEIVTSAQEGGASLGILSGFVAGNFSGYYLGLSMVLLMSIGYLVSQGGLANLMVAEPVFAFGLE